jgi:hypothetical protein
MLRQRAMNNYLQNEPFDLEKETMFITITLQRVPASLVREFALRIASRYPGGVSEALQDLMKNAIRD